MKRFSSDLELYRARRTLSEVKQKLEEALRLSQSRNEKNHEQATPANRHR
jgi:hypothetical protein